MDDPVAQIAADELRASGQSMLPLHLGALLHDIGKGSGADHSEEGEKLTRRAAIRMGFDDATIEQVAGLVRHHLLLSDTATRRDIDDGEVIESVARKIGDTNTLRMLLILSQADGRATGPEAWTPWKASLVGELYRRVLHALETGRLPERSDVGTRLRELESYDPVLSAATGELLQTLPPSYVSSTEVEIMAEELRMLAAGDDAVRCRIDPDPVSGQASITLALSDRPGTLARAAGVLSLHRMSVLRAQAYASSSGKALQRFVVKTPPDPDWTKLEGDLAAVYSSRLALEPRLEKKIKDYGSGAPATVEIRTLGEEALHSTVIEVRALDALGLLYAITRAIEDLDLDIHVAKIDTLGDRVVDVFYVRTLSGEKLDTVQSLEVETSIQHRVRRLLG
jgi:[protein-PII] uridylyltransferase